MISFMQRKLLCFTTKLTLFVVSKYEWDEKKTLISPWRMHCTYYDMTKGTFLAEVASNSEKMSNSEKIKYVPLAIVELH